MPSFLVTGATGLQGGACVNALLESSTSLEIYALTRNAKSPAAQKLSAKGVRVVQGTFDNPDAIFAQIDKPLDGVFSVQGYVGRDGQTVESEERQGKAFFDAAQSAGAKHFVYSSVARNGFQPTPIAMFANKHRVEEYIIKTANIGWTFLQPTSFMDNLITKGFKARLTFTIYEAFTGTDKPTELIATEDIGKVAAKVLLNPTPYNGKSIPLAAESLTVPQMQHIYAKTAKESANATFHIFAYFVGWMVPDVRSMYVWFGKEGYGSDAVAITKEIHPEVMDFETWGKRNLSPR